MEFGLAFIRCQLLIYAMLVNDRCKLDYSLSLSLRVNELIDAPVYLYLSLSFKS